MIYQKIIGLIFFIAILQPSFADVSKGLEVIGSAHGKGLVLKDRIDVVALDDPDLEGVTCYITVFDKALSLDNKSDAAISCVVTSELKVEPTTKANIFSVKKTPFFKKMKVDRFYDKKRNVLIYMVYTKNIAGGENANHGISAVVTLK